MLNTSIFSPSRIAVITGHTFTQLVRMKVFYFFVAFALLMTAASYFELPFSRTTENSAERELIVLKDMAMFGMTLFSMLFAIAATALLIPKDLEDRTLYTILCKPVPRLDYLLGKLAGVILLVAASLLLMDALLSAILHLRTTGLIDAEIARGEALGWPPEYIEQRRHDIGRQGVTWSLQAGISAIFFKAMIMASIALLVSTFSSSTLFTMIVATLVFCIGHFTADARNYWLHTQGAGVSQELKWLSQGIALVFPDFQLYNIIDTASQGKPVSPDIFKRLLVLTLFYCGIYSVLSWFTFRKKEF